MHPSFFPCCDTNGWHKERIVFVSNLFEFEEALLKSWLLALGIHHMTWSYYQPTHSWGHPSFIISEIYLEVLDLAPTLKLWTTLVELDYWIFEPCQMLRKIRQPTHALHSVKSLWPQYHVLSNQQASMIFTSPLQHWLILQEHCYKPTLGKT